MKTSEFKAALQLYDAKVRPYEVYGLEVVVRHITPSVGVVYPHNNLVKLNESRTFGSNSNYGKVVSLMMEYANTPVDQREEEKRYRLRAPINNNVNEPLYLDFNGGFYLSSNWKGRFTQKEIDEMPKGWEDFFIKEEVKND